MADDDDDKADGPEKEGSADNAKSEWKDEGKSGKPEEERSRRESAFSGATSDPLAGATGGTASAGADQAYRSWVETIKSSGPATVIGGGTFRDLVIGGAAPYRHDQAPGPVQTRVLEELTERYARVDGYEALAEHLSDTRLVVLRGAPGSGRATTGLQMLAAATGGMVSRFGPDADLRSLTADELEQGAGYLIELMPGRYGTVPVEAEVDRLRDVLAECGCYMVVVVPNDPRYKLAFDGYITDCPPPRPCLVLEQAVGFEAKRHPEAAEALRALAARLGGSVAPRSPSEAVWLARLMLSCAKEEISLEDLRNGNAEFLSVYVSEWFTPLSGVPATAEADHRIRLAAFRIALAIFNQMPFDMVAEAGERLAHEIAQARSPHRRPGRPVFADTREDFVADSHARLLPGTVKFEKASVPAMFVAYKDERMPAPILRYVWQLHNARGPLTSWLQSLCQDTRPFVWMRAALAIGLLSSWDFSYTFHQLIDPWASSPGDEPEEMRQRLVAGIALDAASRNDEVLPAVREIIDDWCGKGSAEQRWAGAAALCYDLGLQDVQKSLKDLRKVGCWEDGELAGIASFAVARILARGGIDPVVKALQDWLRDDRQLVRELGQLVVLHLADWTVADAEDLDLPAGSDEGRWASFARRRGWPLPVALVAEDPARLDPLVDLIWQVARSAPAQEVVREVLAKWLRAGQKDPSCVRPIAQFLYLLGDDDADRARLLDIIWTLRNDPDEPLAGDIADQFAYAVKEAPGCSETGEANAAQV